MLSAILLIIGLGCYFNGDFFAGTILLVFSYCTRDDD